MRRKSFVSLAVLVLGLSAIGGVVFAKDRENSDIRVKLRGFEEVPAKSTNANGTFKLQIDDNLITFRLTYVGLSTPALFAHIHFGQRSVNGGVSAFLCGGSTKGPCPAGTSSEAVVTGTIGPADVIGPSDQGIAAGEFAELVRAIRAGVAYANVHSPTFPGGEIRAQLTTEEDEGDRD